MKSKVKAPTKKELEKRALEQKLTNMIPEEPPKGKPYYDDYDSYVADYPEGERSRDWLTNRGRDNVVMLLMSKVHGAPHSGLPGHYLAATLTEYPDYRDKTLQKRIVQLALHDCDDGLAVRRWSADGRLEAEKVLENMKQLAPFTMWDAVEFFGLKFG